METKSKTETIKTIDESYKIEYFLKSQTVEISVWFYKESVFGDKYGYKPIYNGLASRILDIAEVVKKLRDGKG